MKTLSFNIIKPLAFTALFIVFASNFNTAEAENHSCTHGAHRKKDTRRCDSTADCKRGACCIKGVFGKTCVWEGNDCNE